ncbi:hypothetical protein L1987_03744 [Smallanthus sonchifolius]|uniref:Uncharacterized protein n=1 Tax=Smallanthus sonchifolius TaxID=185202 RepID=A0ACB9KBI7_9ASTR|nr:hypothetical protein L1987_03744 [Smallanthus sonchifolius]
MLHREGSDCSPFWWENVAVKALMEETARIVNFIERESRERGEEGDDGGGGLGRTQTGVWLVGEGSMTANSASTKRFRVTGIRKIARRRAGKQQDYTIITTSPHVFPGTHHLP